MPQEKKKKPVAEEKSKTPESPNGSASTPMAPPVISPAAPAKTAPVAPARAASAAPPVAPPVAKPTPVASAVPKETPKASDVESLAPPPAPPLPPGPLAPPPVVLAKASSETASDEALPSVVDDDVQSPASWFETCMNSRWSAALWLPFVGLALGITAWVIFSPHWNEEETAEPIETAVVEPVAEEPSSSPAPKVDLSALATKLDRRWLPNKTRLLVSLRMSNVAEQAEAERAIQQGSEFWQPSVGKVLDALGLKLRSVRRLTWAATRLERWTESGVVAIELEEGQDGTVFRSLGEEINLELADARCRRFPQGAWRHPFAVIDARTVVTGPEELLRELTARKEPQFESPAIQRLLKSEPPGFDAWLLIDLAAARQAAWRLPLHWMDVWPVGRTSWRSLWDSPLGLSLSVRRASDGLQSELALACDNDSTAEKVRLALGQLLEAAQHGMAGLADALAAKLQEGELTAREADAYELLLKKGRAVLAASRAEVVDQTVWMRLEWGKNLSLLAAAGLDSPRSILRDWLAAALASDQSNHRRILLALAGYAKGEGAFPAGAGGGHLLPPEERLSWIATLLPYMEHRDWHRELQFGYSWNSPQNRPVAMRPLETMLNPAVESTRTAAGFPVTHYVGVAGVGADAGELKADDPRAGVFGYNRVTKPQDLPGGAANSLAILGVTQQLGPWAAGGASTVRALTRRPYVNGPDGFGSGQPDGMLAAMADGSVRFLSKDIDPVVLEQLAAVGGKKEAAMAVITATSKPNADAKNPAPKEPDKPAVKPPAAAKLPGAVDEGDAAEERAGDMQARLAEPIAEMDLPGVTLLKALRLLGHIGDVSWTLDLDALGQLGVHLTDPVTLQKSGTTLQDLFQTVAAQRGLVCEVAGTQLLLTSPQKHRRELETRKYPVADLTGQGKTDPAELILWIRKFVAPSSWKDTGGQGTIVAAPGELQVSQTAAVHFQIATFCDRLRAVRGFSPQHRPGGDAVQKQLRATRLDLARTELRQAITANFREPTPLPKILADLEQASQATLLVDWVTLAAVDVTPETKASVAVREAAFSKALVELTSPLELTYRIVGPDLFEITTKKAAAARLEIEFHSAAGLAGQGVAGDAILEQVKTNVGGASWSDAGGSGVSVFDPPSRFLIVLQTQPIQAKIQALLTKLQADSAAGKGKP